MDNPNKIFKCLLCDKYKRHAYLATVFKDGSFMCTNCKDEIKSGFHYYVHGKEFFTCPKCGGTGKITNNYLNINIRCLKCQGKGYIYKEENYD